MSSSAASDALARALAEGSTPAPASGGLLPRVVSALVLVPVALAADFAGPVWFAALIAVAGAVGGWEWGRLTRLGGVLALLPALAAPLAAGAELLWGGDTALVVVAALALAAGAWAAVRGRAAASWAVLGVVYIGVPTACIVWLRDAAEPGAIVVLWLFAVVWTTDIGAFFAGRTIGGPRLAPRLSPNKTWAGLIGGMAGAALVAGAFAAATGLGPALLLAALGAALALAAQGGDLFESAVKRRFGAKDSGALIPGHGGVLDRVDGLMTAGPALALVVWLLGGRVAA